MALSKLSSLAWFTGLVISFTVGHKLIGPILDGIGITSFFFKDFVSGFLVAVFAIGILTASLKIGQKLGWINKDTRLPFYD